MSLELERDPYVLRLYRKNFSFRVEEFNPDKINNCITTQEMQKVLIQMRNNYICYLFSIPILCFITFFLNIAVLIQINAFLEHHLTQHKRISLIPFFFIVGTWICLRTIIAICNFIEKRTKKLIKSMNLQKLHPAGFHVSFSLKDDTLEFLRWPSKNEGVLAYLLHFPFVSFPFNEEDLLAGSGPRQIPFTEAKKIVARINRLIPSSLVSFSAVSLCGIAYSLNFWIPFCKMEGFNINLVLAVFFTISITVIGVIFCFALNYSKQKEATVKNVLQEINEKTLSKYELKLECEKPFTMFPLALRVKGRSTEELAENYSGLSESGREGTDQPLDPSSL
eukprot:TRINITY_DN8559_c0_g1_i1.p1 TRINITY_DN8559_c0_g1~~TRINITY_DN8559_c0_g1_i1.p1  ORF type:complete len:336 (-),score=58.64 TRINITY_DN8559_c0_g1_i1:122-1129(-)